MSYIQDLSARFGVNAEERGENGFPVFENNVKGKRVCLLADENTEKYTADIRSELERNGNAVSLFVYPEREPVADEKSVALALQASEKSDYILSVGAGTLNDLGKYAGFLSGKKSGVLATAPSMDGFSSGVTPLIEKGFKITRTAQAANDILIDFDLLQTAPAVMTGAGVGDILAKYCSLSDWKISSLLYGEEIRADAEELMREALFACTANIPKIQKGDAEGISALMNALLISGYAMLLAGNSRPASGAEHHMSHYLEMDYLKRGKRIPLHGVKVGLGTMVSLFLYHNVSRFSFVGEEGVRAVADSLPTENFVANALRSFGCPVKFSEIGVGKDTVKAMLFEAYKIRDRFTILALYNKLGFMDRVADEIIDLYY